MVPYNFVDFIRDPIYGYIPLTEKQKNIVDLPVFQRLKRVKQLSLVDVAYPGGIHSRFSHSLGAMELARRAGEHLLGKKIISEEEKEVLELSALLHDIGHFPFSHVFEIPFAYHVKNVTNPDIAHLMHIEQSKAIITNSDFGIRDIVGKDIADKICEIIDPRSQKEEKILRELITGCFSVDRLDYLRRDAHHCGTPEYGTIDVDRIIFSLTISKRDPTQLLWEERAAYALEQAILSYFNMYRAVYYHRTVRAAYLLFQRVIWEAFEEGIFNKEDAFWKRPDEWVSFDDYTCLQKVRENKATKEVAKLVNLLLERRLPKRLSPEKLYVENRRRLIGLCDNIENKVNTERRILEDIKNDYSECNIIFFDSTRLVPYPHYPYKEMMFYEPLLLTKDGETIPLKSRAPYLSLLEHAWEYERERVYVGYEGTTRLEEKEDFIRRLNDLIRSLISM